MRTRVLIAALVLAAGLAAAKEPRKRPYRLPSVDIKQQVIWGSTCDGPEGTGLAFGGQDQKSPDGRPHTRIKRDGQWLAIHDQLRAANPLQACHDLAWSACQAQRRAAARARFVYFKGLPAEEEAKLVRGELAPLQEAATRAIRDAIDGLKKSSDGLDTYAADQARRAAAGLQAAHKDASAVSEALAGGVAPEAIQAMSGLAVRLEQAAEALDAEPPPRALSPVAYDAKSKLYVLFGGDHCDYLTNDTWVFDAGKPRWQQRHPASAPAPRANHTLAAADGKVTLAGGYTYFSNPDYCGGQYVDIDDGPWAYDLAANAWTGKGQALAPDSRAYRAGPFHPDFYLRGPKGDAGANEKRLAELPANTWVATNPPHLPELNRDWGTAVIDPDHDLMLRFSGGHSAHGGTDVLHYHFSTNRWELCFPVEFPLGQLYSNTSYPEGYNLNRRPWVTGHTYQNYGYDANVKRLLFAGQTRDCFFYDPVAGDWVGRTPKPKGMVYDSCFYTITTCWTDRGLAAWTASGRVFRFDADKKEWVELKLTGAKLPGAVVDNSTVVWDSKRDRLLFAVKGYGEKHTFDGRLHALDLKTLHVSVLSPGGMAEAAAIPYLCQIRYDAANDLLLVGATLPPGPDGLRRTPAYDPAANRWMTLRITGQDPHGKGGRNVSLGMMYDAKRKCFWAVDTHSKVYVLRLDPKTADPQRLGVDPAPQEAPSP